MDTTISIFGYLGFIIAATYIVPQVHKSHITKTAPDLSYTYLCIILFGLMCTVFYTVFYNIIPASIGGFIQLTLVTTLLAQKIYFTRRHELLRHRAESSYRPPQTFI